MIKADLPEMKREDIHLTFESNVLTLSGERTLETSEGAAPQSSGSTGRSRGRSRCRTRSTATRISAAYKDGVLTVRVPQREEVKPKQIEVTAGVRAVHCAAGWEGE